MASSPAEAAVLCRPRASGGEATASPSRHWRFLSCDSVFVQVTPETGVSGGWTWECVGFFNDVFLVFFTVLCAEF